MVEPVFEEDFFQRIVNVQWSKPAFFVAVTLKGAVHYADFTKEDPILRQASLPISNIISLVGCDYVKIGEKPIFALAGTYAIPDQPFPSGGIGDVPVGFVCVSNDGSHWEKTWETERTDNWNWHSINAIVYSPDNNSFYLSGATQKGSDTAGFTLHETLYSSSDGSSFDIVSEKSIATLEDQIANESAFPLNYCSHNKDCDDDYHHSVPGGIMWFDKLSKIQMRPLNPPTVYYFAGQFGHAVDYHTLPRHSPVGEDPPRGEPGSSTIHIELQDKGSDVAATQTDSADPAGLAIAVGVAGSGSTWMAGGFETTSDTGPGAVSVSKDKGQTWELFGSTASGVVGVMVGEVKPDA